MGEIRKKRARTYNKHRRDRFVREYLIDYNATQAAIRAGYDPDKAGTTGPRLINRDEYVRAEIAKLSGKALEKLEISADRLMDELAKIAFGDIRQCFDKETGELLAPHKWPDDVAACVAGVDSYREGDKTITRFKRYDKLKAIELLGRTLKISMFAENTRLVDANGDDLTALNETERTNRIAAILAAGQKRAKLAESSKNQPRMITGKNANSSRAKQKQNEKH